MANLYSLHLPVEIRWHGRGGQGAVTAANLLAEVAISAGKYAQSFPQFGSERRGAPIQAFTRIDERMITLYNSVQKPNILIVLDKSLLAIPSTLNGLQKNGLILVNAEYEELTGLMKPQDASLQIATVPATRIALEHIHRPMTNTTMLGAFIGVTGLLDLDEVKSIVEKKLDTILNREMVNANLRTLSDGFSGVKMVHSMNR